MRGLRQIDAIAVCSLAFSLSLLIPFGVQPNRVGGFPGCWGFRLELRERKRYNKTVGAGKSDGSRTVAAGSSEISVQVPHTVRSIYIRTASPAKVAAHTPPARTLFPEVPTALAPLPPHRDKQSTLRRPSTPTGSAGTLPVTTLDLLHALTLLLHLLRRLLLS